MNEITMTEQIKQKLDYIQTSYHSIKMEFFRIGEYMYFIKENFDHVETYITYNQQSYLPKSQYTGWLQLLKDAFDLDETTIYKYINLYLKFSDHPVFKEYGLSQLIEMLPVPLEALEVMHLTQDMTVREIRKKVKNALALDKPPEDVDNVQDKEKSSIDFDALDTIIDKVKSAEDEETQMSVDNYENQMEEDQRKIDAIKTSIDMTMQSFNNKIKYKEMEIKDSPKNMKIRGHLEQLQADQKILQGMLDHIDEIYRSNEFRWL
jgi:hypothetical protein